MYTVQATRPPGRPRHPLPEAARSVMTAAAAAVEAALTTCVKGGQVYQLDPHAVAEVNRTGKRFLAAWITLSTAHETR